MGRIYTAPFSGQAETAQCDLFELVAPADMIVKILEVHFGQLLDVGDAAEEMLLLHLKSGQTTSGSGGNITTRVPRLFTDVASTVTVEDTNTTKATGGTIVTHYSWLWNVRIPFDKIWTPETCPILSPSRRCTFELATTPGDSLTFNGTVVFEEVGG